jgi:hypothetical protein
VEAAWLPCGVNGAQSTLVIPWDNSSQLLSYLAKKTVRSLVPSVRYHWRHGCSDSSVICCVGILPDVAICYWAVVSRSVPKIPGFSFAWDLLLLSHVTSRYVTCGHPTFRELVPSPLLDHHFSTRKTIGEKTFYLKR